MDQEARELIQRMVAGVKGDSADRSSVHCEYSCLKVIIQEAEWSLIGNEKNSASHV